MTDIPTAIEEISCTLNTCSANLQRNLYYITFQINKECEIGELQSFLENRTELENMNCGQKCTGLKNISTTISKTHLFIDVLYWEGRYIYLIN